MNTVEASYLEVHHQRSALGKIEQVTYEIKGKSPFIKVSGSFINDDVALRLKKDIVLGPYHLKFVDYEYYNDIAIYTIKSPLGYILAFFYRITRWLDLVYRRFIITLAVWNLADFHPEQIPSWEDVKLLKWLSTK